MLGTKNNNPVINLLVITMCPIVHKIIVHQGNTKGAPLGKGAPLALLLT